MMFFNILTSIRCSALRTRRVNKKMFDQSDSSLALSASISFLILDFIVCRHVLIFMFCMLIMYSMLDKSSSLTGFYKHIFSFSDLQDFFIMKPTGKLTQTCDLSWSVPRDVCVCVCVCVFV